MKEAAQSSAALECHPDSTARPSSRDSGEDTRSASATDVRYETSGEDVVPRMSSTSVLPASRDLQI